MADWDIPRVAVVGVGVWGRNHVRNFAELGALAAVVDRSGETARHLSEEYGVPALSYREVLGSPTIDGIVFALPPSQNLPLGREALAAGKHLLIEKPMTLTAAGGEELCRLAEQRGRRLMVGHILQHHPAFEALLQLTKEGRLGRLQALSSRRLDLGRIRREEDALWALAPHDLSMILALAGREPDHVAAAGGFHTHPSIADAAAVELRFAEGLRATIDVSWLHPFKEQRLVAIGSEAMAVFDDREPWETKLVLYRHRVSSSGSGPITERAPAEPITVARAEPLKAECQAFLRSIRSGERPRTDGWEAVRVIRVLEAASVALAAGRSLA